MNDLTRALYQSACDSAEEWKQRAIRAEEITDRLMHEINEKTGPTFMGEPVIRSNAKPTATPDAFITIRRLLRGQQQLIADGSTDLVTVANTIAACINKIDEISRGAASDATSITKQQVLDMATNVRDCAWPSGVKEYMVLIEPMLRSYAALLDKQPQGGMYLRMIERACDELRTAGIEDCDDLCEGIERLIKANSVRSVSDEALRVMAVVVLAECGETRESVGEWSFQQVVETQRKAIDAAIAKEAKS